MVQVVQENWLGYKVGEHPTQKNMVSLNRIYWDLG